MALGGGGPPITTAGAVDQMAPLPTLTSIGTLGAETVLVDLERLGSVGLQGDEEACRHLMTHMATELAHQSWSDGVNVTLVGWGQNLVQLNPDRLTYSGSLHGIAQGLTARVREVTAALTGLDTGVVQARSQDIAGDSWTPQVLLIDATGFETGDIDDLHRQLSALSNAGRVATAVVMRGGLSNGRAGRQRPPDGRRDADPAGHPRRRQVRGGRADRYRSGRPPGPVRQRRTGRRSDPTIGRGRAVGGAHGRLRCADPRGGDG